jgi:glutaredoxin
VAKLELYGMASCPYTREMRDRLDWEGREYVEYDVELDPAARSRILTMRGVERTVPVLVEDGKVVQIGWEGRGCLINGLESSLAVEAL